MVYKVRVFFATILPIHYHLYGKDKVFDLTTLLDDLGFDPKDWSCFELNHLWEYWYQSYSVKTSNTVAHKIASITSASRCGAALKQILLRDFKNKFKKVGINPIGRFGGKTRYMWL